MSVQSNNGWADRLGTTARISLIVIVAILGLLATGIVVGLSVAIVEEGFQIKSSVYVVTALAIGLSAVFGLLLAKLVRSMRFDEMSRFDRRYWKMWVVVAIVGVPLGFGLSMMGDAYSGDSRYFLLSNGPIPPVAAIVAAVFLVATLTFAAVHYHRTVDDHEHRAYQWGSTIAYYFLMFAFPTYWLLQRGGLLPTLGIGIALLIIILSALVQAIVWALFKFR